MVLLACQDIFVGINRLFASVQRYKIVAFLLTDHIFFLPSFCFSLSHQLPCKVLSCSVNKCYKYVYFEPEDKSVLISRVDSKCFPGSLILQIKVMAGWVATEAGGHSGFFLSADGRQRKHPCVAIPGLHSRNNTQIFTNVKAELLPSCRVQSEGQTERTLCCHWQDEVWPPQLPPQSNDHCVLCTYMSERQLESISG